MERLTKEMFKYNPEVIKSLLKNKGEGIITTDDLVIYYPLRYDDVGLASTSDTVNLLTVFIMVDSKFNYNIVNKPTFIKTEPMSIDEVTIDGIEYKKLLYKKDNFIIVNRNVVKSDSFAYSIFNEFFIQGKIPFYVSYESLMDLLMNIREFANSPIADNPIAIETIISILGRSESDTKLYYRQVLNRKEDKTPMKFIALKNVQEGYNNVISKVTGSYFKEGLTSALVNPQETATDIEKILLT